MGTPTMRAVRILGPGRASLVEVPRPDPSPTELRVRLEGSGVCASNLGPWQGLPWIDYPLGPGATGHEGWGVVDAVGAAVRHVHEGDRVALLSEHAYADYDVATPDAVVPLPPALDALPFPGEPLACAMNAFRRSGVEPGQTVAVIGVGFLGAVLTGLAREAGARVIALSRRPFALDVARRMGADACVPLDDHARVLERVRDLVGGGGCERVLECAGKQWPLDLAGELVGVRGRLVLVGYHQDGPRQVNVQAWNWKGIDVVNAHERDPQVYVRGMREGIEAVTSGRLDLAALLTHAYPLERLDEALDATAARPEGFLKAVVRT